MYDTVKHDFTVQQLLIVYFSFMSIQVNMWDKGFEINEAKSAHYIISKHNHSSMFDQHSYTVFFVLTITGEDILTVRKNFQDVRHLLYDIRYKWETIGYALGLTRADIKNLKGSDDEKLSEVVDKWLKRHKPSPTWETLVAVLRHTTVEADDIADMIEAKYLREDGMDIYCFLWKQHKTR